MKLYATVTSERASKGQGGNEYLKIDVTDENETNFFSVYIQDQNDIKEEVYAVALEYLGASQTLFLPKSQIVKNTKKKKCGNCGRPATVSISEDINRCERCTDL